MALIFEQQKKMPREEAVTAIRNCLIRMQDAANRQASS
jgi:hypothetical protein